jgi:hypothetical protein
MPTQIMLTGNKEQVHRDQSQACSHMAVVMRHKRQRSIDDYQHRQET